jgi:hypothetical protein
MGGRGSSSKLFTIPGSGGGNFSNNTLIEQLPKTVKEALGAKGAAKSISTSLKEANPRYSAAFSEYSENCQRCVVAYELQRRGYDVEAQPTYAGDKWPQVVNVNGQRLGRWRGAFRHAVTDKVGASGNNAKAEAKVLQNIYNRMKSYGAGARAVINIGYRGSHSGHVFNAEYSGGRVQYLDAQTGERYSTADMRNFLHIVETSTVGLTRTDNLRVSERAKDFVWTKRNR